MSSSQTSTPKTPLRPSKFIEGDPLTRPDLLQRTPTSNELLHNILSEMDAFESKRRQHRGSNSSNESLPSRTPSPIVAKADHRRSFGGLRPSLDERDRAPAHGEEGGKLSLKFKGRLRAFTTGAREVKQTPYSGT